MGLILAASELRFRAAPRPLGPLGTVLQFWVVSWDQESSWGLVAQL
jgi:hypothetical protein